MKLFETRSHPTEGDVVSIRPTALFSKTPTSIRRLAPALGQDSSEILREAGFDQDGMDQLYEKHVVYSPGDK